MSQDENKTTDETVEENTGTAETAETVDLDEYPQDHPLVKTLAKQRAELKELKDLRKTHSEAAKELDELRKAQLTEQERLIEQTKEDTRRSVSMEYAEKLVEAELKTSLKGKSLNGDSILQFDRTAFIHDNGDVDSDAIATWVEAHSTNAEAPKPDLGQGARGSNSSLAQIRSREELQSMKPSEILAARNDGRLDSLMGKP